MAASLRLFLRSNPGLLLGAALALLRLGFLAFPNLIPEEAYYWNYARHLDIGYLDHPPLVAWLIYAGTAIFGDTEFGVRIFAFASSLVTAVFTYRLAALLYDRRAAAMAVLIVQVLPFFFTAGMIMTPDAPLTACWAAALYYLARVLVAGDGGAWLGVGIFLGLGMLSKYTIALLGPATLLFLALDPAARCWFCRTAPYLAVALAAAIFSPVIVWNARHHWASFAFQSTGRIKEGARFSMHELAGAILVVLTPVGAILAWRALRERLAEAAVDREARRRLFVRLFTLVPLAVFVAFSLRHRVKLNWTGPLWLAIIPSMAAQLQTMCAGRRNWLRHAWAATAAGLALVYALTLDHLSFGIPHLGYSKKTELLPVGWSQLGEDVERRADEVRRTAPGRFLVVGLDRNFIASEAAFYNSDRARAVRDTTGPQLFGGIALMYAYWFPPAEQAGATLLLVSFDKHQLDRGTVQRRCGQLGPIEKSVLTRDGHAIRPFFMRVAYNYQPPPAGGPH